jgi:nucleoid DNA-binding protein
MINQEIIEKISSYFNLPQFEAEKIYEEILSMIMHGAKEDSIVELTDFGEFILRENIGDHGGSVSSQDLSENNKTVEFVSSSKLEDAIGRGTYGFPKTINVQAPNVEQESVSDDKEKDLPSSSIEEEMKRKREELLQKISVHPLQDAALQKDKPVMEEHPLIKPEETPTTQELYTQHEENLPLTGIAKEEVSQPPESGEKPVESFLQGEDDLSKKSFSDYFAVAGKEPEPAEEPKSEEKPEPENIPEPQPEHVQPTQFSAPSVIPQTAIDLHNEIVGAPVDTEKTETEKSETVKAEDSQTVVTPTGEVIPEQKAEDNSYYIWYKDSEATPSETQTLSYEYELLYQATKEAEYKSKLKIYVSSFILFFSLVLVLLIFSPVIYKFLFNPVEYPETQITQQENIVPEQNPATNVPQTTPPSQQQNTTATDTSGKQLAQTNANQQSQQQTEAKQTEQPQQQTQPTTESTEPKIEGVTRNALGWVDDKYKVMYIKLDNGKFTIQESSFDSDSKALKRISDVEVYKIEGLKGTSVKSDLGSKGTWYRVRFGEFQTIEEARAKAQELRNKVKI